MQYDLSILIPARNEEFLPNTVDDIMKNKRGKTEVIVVLDGAWGKGIPQYDDLRVVYLPESIGQRAATNLAAKLSKAKYIMKLDAHCAFDEGFDVKLMADMQDDWTVVPIMRNLHVFDWVCPNGHRRYQSPSGVCTECGQKTEKDIVWIGKESPQSTSYRFNRRLEFKYFGEYKDRQVGDLVETMSLQGSCFMCTRDKYWELDICDESWGSWGGQGAEVALKTWLSGGRVLCNKKTWYAHLFRTQGGDFSFPYENPGKEQLKAKDSLRDTFLTDNWSKATRTLDWLVEKFKPVPDWHYPDIESQRLDKKGAIYYTDNRLEGTHLANRVREQITKGIKEKHIVSCTLKPLNFGRNFVLDLEPGYLTMFKQILKALEECYAEVIFFLEHDVMYHPSHFDFIPPQKDIFYYNVNVWKMRAEDQHLVSVDDCRQVSGLVAYRDLLIAHYKDRIERVEKDGFSNNMGFEPGTHGRIEGMIGNGSDIYRSKYPNIDVRHNKNLTKNRWSKEEFKSRKYTVGWKEAYGVEGWDMKELENLI